MRGRICVAVLFSFLFNWLNAQTVKNAPYSDDYQLYLENPSLFKDYIPHPFRVTYAKTETKSAQMLPEQFDLRNVNGKNYLTPIKNQGSYGTCWAFAASASIESYWLKLGLPEVALSVRNFANCHGFDWNPFDGGNAFLATAYLSRLSGPVYEWADPYSNMSVEGCKSFSNDSVIPAHISRMYKASGSEVIKQLIMKYGAVATSMSTNNFNTHFNSSTNTYYYNSAQPIDHGVTIVGWDDNKVVNGIPSGNPPEKGAWIIKNSWGSSWGDNGFFYVSYYDKYVGKEISLYPGRIEKEETDTLYLYDRLGASTSHGITNADNMEVAYALVRYVAPKSQVINRIGSFINSGSTILDITVSKGWDGSALFDTIESQSGIVCRFPGYHSYEFSSVVDSGEFFVQIRYETPGYSWPIPIETIESGFSNPKITPIGVQWISSDGSTWEDVGLASENNFDLCVRAYAKDFETPIAILQPLKPKYCIGSTFEVINKSAGIADSFTWLVFNSDTVFDTIVTKNINDYLQYTLSEPGFVDIKLIAHNPLKNDTITRYQAIEMVNETEIYIINNNGSNTIARNKQVSLTAFGADNYIWSSTSDYSEATGEILTFTITSPELWVKVKGILGNCEAWDSILIKSVNVLYDDIKDAHELSLNTVQGPFNNFYATVEPKEPKPDEGDCDNQISWCTEGGLHNSIWFKFKAPITGAVNIISYGFDNQLALYEPLSTGSWEDILSGDETKFKLLAANDDAHSTDYSAEISTVSDLTPGKMYWIQMDGSAGGEEGEVTIKVEAPLPTLLDYPVKVYPTIAFDSMRIDLKGMNDEGVTLSIYDMQGRLMICEQVDWSMLGNDLSDENSFGVLLLKRYNIAHGLYIIEIRNSKIYYINKLRF